VEARLLLRPPQPEERDGDVARSGPNLKPGTVCVCGMSGLRKGMNTTQHPPSPTSRAETDLSTNAQAVSRAVSSVNTHRPRFQVRAQPSYEVKSTLRVLYNISVNPLRETACICIIALET